MKKSCLRIVDFNQCLLIILVNAYLNLSKDEAKIKISEVDAIAYTKVRLENSWQK